MATKELRDEDPPSTEVHRVDQLRTLYRVRWDAYQLIAHSHRAIVKAGGKLTDEQVAAEARAVAAVEVARDELLAAIFLLGH